MKVVKLRQGSPEWHAHRLIHRNASEASVPLAKHPSIKRGEWIRLRATGVDKEVSAFLQSLFDEGHAFEDLARPLAEKVMGEDLYPVTGVLEGTAYSASFDGMTMGEEGSWEHKMLNNVLREIMVEGCTGADLPDYHQIQMEHQCMVSGCEKVLFTASDWTPKGELIDIRHCWYTPNPELRRQLLAGWEQAELDIQAFKENPTPVAVAVVAKPAERMPVAFKLVTSGKVVSCNLEEFTPMALKYIDDINTTLVTDQDFADAVETARYCRDTAKSIRAAVDTSLKDMGDISKALDAAAVIEKAFDAKGLALEKLVDAEKLSRKRNIVLEAQGKLEARYRELDEELGSRWMPACPQGLFVEAIKSMRSFDSMVDKTNGLLAVEISKAEATAERLQENREMLKKDGTDWITLFADFAMVGLKARDDFEAAMALRVQNHKAAESARLEKERADIRAEEAAKLKAENDAKAAAEAQEKADAEAKAESERIAAEKAATTQAETATQQSSIGHTEQVQATPAQSPVAQSTAAPTTQATASHPRTSYSPNAIGYGRHSGHNDFVRQAAAPTPAPAAAPAPVTQSSATGALDFGDAQTPADLEDDGERVKLGDINAMLEYSQTTAGDLARLGFEHVAVEKSAKLYRKCDLQAIGQAMVDHIVIAFGLSK